MFVRDRIGQEIYRVWGDLPSALPVLIPSFPPMSRYIHYSLSHVTACQFSTGGRLRFLLLLLLGVRLLNRCSLNSVRERSEHIVCACNRWLAYALLYCSSTRRVQSVT